MNLAAAQKDGAGATALPGPVYPAPSPKPRHRGGSKKPSDNSVSAGPLTHEAKKPIGVASNDTSKNAVNVVSSNQISHVSVNVKEVSATTVTATVEVASSIAPASRGPKEKRGNQQPSGRPKIAHPVQNVQQTEVHRQDIHVQNILVQGQPTWQQQMFFGTKEKKQQGYKAPKDESAASNSASKSRNSTSRNPTQATIEKTRKNQPDNVQKSTEGAVTPILSEGKARSHQSDHPSSVQEISQPKPASNVPAHPNSQSDSRPNIFSPSSSSQPNLPSSLQHLVSSHPSSPPDIFTQPTTENMNPPPNPPLPIHPPNRLMQPLPPAQSNMALNVEDIPIHLSLGAGLSNPHLAKYMNHPLLNPNPPFSNTNHPFSIANPPFGGLGLDFHSVNQSLVNPINAFYHPALVPPSPLESFLMAAASQNAPFQSLGSMFHSANHSVPFLPANHSAPHEFPPPNPRRDIPANHVTSQQTLEAQMMRVAIQPRDQQPMAAQALDAPSNGQSRDNHLSSNPHDMSNGSAQPRDSLRPSNVWGPPDRPATKGPSLLPLPVPPQPLSRDSVWSRGPPKAPPPTSGSDSEPSPHQVLSGPEPNKFDLITKQSEDLIQKCLPPQDEVSRRNELLDRLSRIICKQWPDAQLHLFGSSANSLCLRDHDLDVCITLDCNKDLQYKRTLIQKLAGLLRKNKMLEVVALSRARVPIVKFKDPATRFSCDICINNHLASRNTQLLFHYSQLDDRFRHLAMLVKFWAKQREINEPYRGTLSSYAYALMLVHMLQRRQPPILPTLQLIDPTGHLSDHLPTEVVDGYNCYYYKDIDRLRHMGNENHESIGELLAAFYAEYAEKFDYETSVVSARTGRYLSKKEKGWDPESCAARLALAKEKGDKDKDVENNEPDKDHEQDKEDGEAGGEREGLADKDVDGDDCPAANRNHRHLMCVEDPFEIDLDLGRVVDKRTLHFIQLEFQRAHRICSAPIIDMQLLFKPYEDADFPELFAPQPKQPKKKDKKAAQKK